MNRVVFVLLGTDPDSGRGGIANALPGYIQALREEGLEVEFVPTHDARRPALKWLLWPVAALRLVRLILSIQKQGIACCVYAHAGPGISLVRKLSLLRLARVLGATTLIHLHSISIIDYIRSTVLRRLLSRHLRKVDGVCVLTDWWKTQLEPFVKTLFVIPNPLDNALVSVAREEPQRLRQRTGKKILTMARLEPGKGIDTTIWSLTCLSRNWTCQVAGSGSDESRLKKLAQDIGVSDRVHFCGWLSRNERDAALKNADIFCLPSRFDSFGMVYLEAMAFGKPVVAGKFGPLADVVPPEWLVEEMHAESVASAIEERASEPSKIQAARAKAWVLDRYTPRVVGKKLRKVAEAVVGEMPCK